MSLGALTGAIEWTSSEEESVNRMANEMMRAGVTLFIANRKQWRDRNNWDAGKRRGCYYRRFT